MLHFVTSVNENLFEKYGARAFREFEAYSDRSIRLHVVFEGDLPKTLPLYENVNFITFHSPEHRDFLAKFGHLHEANGLRIKAYLENGVQKVNLSWDYRYNAVRFSFKIFSITQVLRSIADSSHLVWLDADIRVLSPFNYTDLIPFLPADGELMAYLGRQNFPKPNAYSEAGWLAFNLNHPDINNFLSFVSDQYTSGKIFSQAEWHDSWIWDVARVNFESKGTRFKNISGALMDCEHPFINCGLGRYFDHLKGPERKELGRSPSRDVMR